MTQTPSPSPRPPRRAPGAGRKPRPDAAFRRKRTVTLLDWTWKALQEINPDTSAGDTMDRLVYRATVEISAPLVRNRRAPDGTIRWFLSTYPTVEYNDYRLCLLAALRVFHQPAPSESSEP